jgi:uncharacterized protein YndB with AHSA1/START domain
MLSYGLDLSKEAVMPEVDNSGYTVKYETHIPAPRATVFAFLLDPDKLLRWMGTGSEMDPHPGGIYLLKGVAGKHNARGTFKEVVPVHRLAYSFGWDHRAEVPPDSTLIEIDLEERGQGTLLKITHSGLPTEEERAAHAKGWTHYIDRLGKVLSGEPVEPDQPW